MEKNFKIKNNYVSNNIIETIEEGEKKYWTNYRISLSYYTRYYLFKILKKFIKKINIKSVLDSGCVATVKLIKFILPGCQEVYGSDQEVIIEFCRKKFGLNTFFADDIENSKLDLKKKFDLIICADVIEHLLNPDKLITYIKKFSHTETIIIITTPERDTRRGRNCYYSPKPSHIREWNNIEFKSYLNSRNFKMFYHNQIEEFKVLLNFKQPFFKIKRDFLMLSSLTKKYNNIYKIKHCQLVVCKLKNSNNSLNHYILNNFYKNSVLRDLFNLFLIKVYRLISEIYKYYNAYSM